MLEKPTYLNSEDTYEWNDSLNDSYLWSNVNFGEAIPQVMTPLTWSVQKSIYEAWNLIAGYQSTGNIGGRVYFNLSVHASALHTLGKSKQKIIKDIEGLLYTRIPEGIEIPMIDLPFNKTFLTVVNFLRIGITQASIIRTLPTFLRENPAWCTELQNQIRETNRPGDLRNLWENQIIKHLQSTVSKVMASVIYFSDYTMKLRQRLIELTGNDDADILLSNLSTSSDVKDPGLLASLGPLMGISKIASGELDQESYLAMYGHRGSNEFELSVPRPAEDLSWLDNHIEYFRESPAGVEKLLSQKQQEIDAVWKMVTGKYPKKSKKMHHLIDTAASRARLREAVRSEYVRDRWIARTFALRAGELKGLEGNVFFLTIKEVLDILSGDDTPIKFIPARKESYRKYSDLPAYPSIICGSFDPFKWAEDPNRHNEFYIESSSNSNGIFDGQDPSRKDPWWNQITGIAGSAGQIEGIVRRLNSPEEGERLRNGEIIVTSHTDIAWTLLFPKASAIITDVGAPLSHAAIVARELGIPAVVGCGNATVRLSTGDRVFVDGSRGIVRILNG